MKFHPTMQGIFDPVLDTLLNPYTVGGGPTGNATLVIFAGQSNSIGWSTDPANTTTLTGGNGYDFRPTGATGVWLPTGITMLGRTQGGPQAAFAKTWTDAAGGTVLCVNVGVNGCTMDVAAQAAQTGNIATLGYESLGAGTWDLSAGGVGSVYTQTGGAQDIIENAITAAEAAGFTIAKKIVVWAQGESDAGANALTNGTAYKTKLTALIDRFVADFDIDAFLISELGAPSTGTNAFWDAIRTAQTTTAAARSSIATVAFGDAENFQAAGKMVDTLHYTQTGYNEMGIALATNGLAFIGGLTMSEPLASIYAGIVASPPAIDRYKRMVLTTVRNGAFGPNFYSGPTTPNAITWMDDSDTNKMRAAQACGMNFASAASKKVYVYVSNTIGTSGTFVGSGNAYLTKMEILDSSFRLNTINLGSVGDLEPTFTFPIADANRLDPSIIRFLGLSDGGISAVAFDNTVLSTLTGLTSLFTSQSLTGALDYTLIPNVVGCNNGQAGLSVAQVNAALIALNTNGKSNGACNFVQYRLSPAIAAAPPSGAGATAKTSLQGKGWTVNTD